MRKLTSKLKILSDDLNLNSCTIPTLGKFPGLEMSRD